MRAILTGSLLVTLARPSTWVLALAAFLIRGGLLLFLLPIVVIPTPAGLADLVGPLLISFVFGGVSTAFVVLVVVATAAGVAWLIGGGLLAAVAEAELIRIVATDEEVATDEPIATATSDGRVAGRILLVRLAALLPFAGALAIGTSAIVAATYRELTLPGDAGTPIAWRVLRSVPGPVLLMVLTWLLGEIVGGRAARSVVLDGRSVAAALGGSIVGALRHPLRTAIVFAVPSIGLLLVLIPAIAAASGAWRAVQVGLSTGDSVPIIAAVIAFVALWGGGLLLAGVACAWRHAAWTVAARRLEVRAPVDGSSADGDWNPNLTSGTL